MPTHEQSPPVNDTTLSGQERFARLLSPRPGPIATSIYSHGARTTVKPGDAAERRQRRTEPRPRQSQMEQSAVDEGDPGYTARSVGRDRLYVTRGSYSNGGEWNHCLATLFGRERGAGGRGRLNAGRGFNQGNGRGSFQSQSITGGTSNTSTKPSPGPSVMMESSKDASSSMSFAEIECLEIPPWMESSNASKGSIMSFAVMKVVEVCPAVSPGGGIDDGLLHDQPSQQDKGVKDGGEGEDVDGSEDGIEDLELLAMKLGLMSLEEEEEEEGSATPVAVAV